MPVALDGVQVVLGLVLLYFGAEWLVAGAAGLARSFGIKPLIIGLTVVAYGTSAPELVVGIGAGLRGQGAIALGNVVGSNVANLGLILGLCAIVRPAIVDRQIVAREVPVLVLTTALIPTVLLDGHVGMLEALGLLVLAAGYTTWMVLTSRRGTPEDAAEMAGDAAKASASALPERRYRLGAITVAGLVLLVAGGHFLVTGAVGIAAVAGMSERVIGLTIVAIGTSLPELATGLVAAVRGHGDLAIGNVVGSNIFNVLLILGASGTVGAIDARLHEIAIDLVALGAMTMFAAIAMTTRRRVGQIEGVILVLSYVAFLAALALH